MVYHYIIPEPNILSLEVSFGFTNTMYLTSFHMSLSFLPNVEFGVSCMLLTSFLAEFKEYLQGIFLEKKTAETLYN